jgi:hypothetical protein
VSAHELAEAVLDRLVGLGDLAGVGLACHQQLAVSVDVEAEPVGDVSQPVRERQVVQVAGAVVVDHDGPAST